MNDAKVEALAVNFQILTGNTDAGWCNFTVQVGEVSWACRASYIGSYPLFPLIHSAVNLYNQRYMDSIPIENAVCDSYITGEPGGILIRATPEGDRVAIHVFCDSELVQSSSIDCSRAVASTVIDLWEYLDAIFADAHKAIARQGFLGLRNGWRGLSHWGIDFEYSILPIEQFLYLAYIVRHRKPPVDSSFTDELDLLELIGKSK